MSWKVLTTSSLPVLLAATVLGADTTVLVPARDNTLYEVEPASEGNGGFLSNGAGEYLFAGRTLQLGPSRRRALLAFDVAGTLPAGATVIEAVLTLEMSRTVAGPVSVELRPVLADWGEGSSDALGDEGSGAPAEPGDATWLHTFFDGAFWATAGGDFAGTASAIQTVGGPGPYSWGSTAEMVADVQAWLDDPGSNFGWLLLADESSQPTAKRFNSRENGAAGSVPQLAVTFQVPVPSAPPWSRWLLTFLLALAGLWWLWNLTSPAAPRSSTLERAS